MHRRMMQRIAVSTVAMGGLLAGIVGPATASEAAGTGHASADGVHAEISRDTVISNAKEWLNNHKIDYNSGERAKGANGKRYRKDCSGFVSEALGLSAVGGGPSTVDLIDDVHKIKYSSLAKGDLIGLLGDGTGGANGHVMLFVKWGNKSHSKAVVWEHGGGSGSHAYPHQDTHSVPVSDSRGEFKAYRYDKIS